VVTKAQTWSRTPSILRIEDDYWRIGRLTHALTQRFKRIATPILQGV
jgi:hypothetical protein